MEENKTLSTVTTETTEENKTEKKTVKKSRDFFIRTYLPEKAFREVIGMIGAQHWAYIRHDKEECEPHYHIVLRLNNPTTAGGIERKLKLKGKGADNGKDINSVVQIAKCFDECFAYLTHENFPEKVQYPVSAIVTDDFGYFRGKYSSLNNDDTTAPCIENTAYQILHDIESGVDMRTMARRYGREYIINHQAYRNYVQMMKEEEEDRKRCMEFKQRMQAINEKRYDDFAHEIRIIDRFNDLSRIRTDVRNGMLECMLRENEKLQIVNERQRVLIEQMGIPFDRQYELLSDDTLYEDYEGYKNKKGELQL